MEWTQRFNLAIEYIERNLRGEIDLERAAREAACSVYHFQRMFVYVTNITPWEYIRRRRMTLAAADLCEGKEKVIDIALKYGYNSPTAFNRAFQAVHGVPPSAVKGKGARLMAYPSLHFQFILKGAEQMNYKIEKKDAFCAAGVCCPLEKDLEKNFTEIPKLWQSCAENGTLARLALHIAAEPQGILGLSMCWGEEWKYAIGVAIESAPQGFESFDIPARTWAIFEGSGKCPEAIQNLEREIFTQWLPTSGYEYDLGPDVELYLSPDRENAKFQVWVPVKKK